MNRLRLLLVSLTAAGCAAAPRRHRVEIRDLSFAPATIEVVAGDTIIWANRDMFPHTATADGASGWDTGEIPAEGEGAAVARRPGIFEYICRVHPTMRGRVIVR